MCSGSPWGTYDQNVILTRYSREADCYAEPVVSRDLRTFYQGKTIAADDFRAQKLNNKQLRHTGGYQDAQAGAVSATGQPEWQVEPLKKTCSRQ